MNATKLIGALLIVAGVLGLAFGGFSFTKQTHQAQIGPIAITSSERENVNIPLWASVIVIAAGAGILISSSRNN